MDRGFQEVPLEAVAIAASVRSDDYRRRVPARMPTSPATVAKPILTLTAPLTLDWVPSDDVVVEEEFWKPSDGVVVVDEVFMEPAVAAPCLGSVVVEVLVSVELVPGGVFDELAAIVELSKADDVATFLLEAGGLKALGPASPYRETPSTCLQLDVAGGG